MIHIGDEIAVVFIGGTIIDNLVLYMKDEGLWWCKWFGKTIAINPLSSAIQNITLVRKAG